MAMPAREPINEFQQMCDSHSNYSGQFMGENNGLFNQAQEIRDM